MAEKDPLEITILKATIRTLEEECGFHAAKMNRLTQDLEFYRKEAERLQNLWYDALANQIFPPVKVETITMKKDI